MVSAAGPVVESVTRKRIVPPAELAQEKTGRTTPDFWEFIEKMTPDMWGETTLYILREDPKPSLYGGTNTLEKCPGYIAMPDGTKQPLNSREDIELAIKQKYGGKAFRLILKRLNGERICEGKCINEAPPRYPDNTAPPQNFSAPGAPGNSSDAVAVKAMDTIANQNPQLINIAIDAVSRAADIISRHEAPKAAPPEDDLDRQLKRAMLERFLNPPQPPDPFELFIKFKTLLGDGGTGNPVMARLMDAAVEKILNPVPAVSGRTTLLDIGREVLPSIVTTVREGMHDYRLSMEAQARIVEMQRGQPGPQAVPQPAPAPVQQQQLPQPAANPQPAQAAAAPAPAAAPPPGALTFHQIEAHIAKIVRNVEYPIDEAVDRVLSFLYDTDGRVVQLLLDPPKLDPRLAAGEAGLMMLFQFEPILQPCLQPNPARVSEFIKKFLAVAKESEEAEARLRAAAPAAAAAAPAPA